MLALRELAVGLREALDQHAYEGLVEADLAGRGGDAQRAGLDLHRRDAAVRRNGGGAPLDRVGEVEDFAEAAAGLEDAERLAAERDLGLAVDQDLA